MIVTTNIIVIISLWDGWGILTSKEGPEGWTPAEFEELPRPGVGVLILLLHHVVTEVTNILAPHTRAIALEVTIP